LKQNWFYRLLLSYLPVFFIVIAILFLAFFQALNEQSRKEAVNANTFLASQVLQHVDSELKKIEYHILSGILTDSFLAQYFTGAEVTVLDNIQAVKIMDELKFQFPVIDSVYFVRLKDDYILADGSFRSDDFPDKTFIRQIVDQQHGSPWTGRRLYKAYASVTGKEVVTLARRVPHFATQASGFIVINVGLDKMQRSLSQIYNPDISFVRLSDDQGQWLLGEPDPIAEPGRQQVFASYVSSYTGWQVESGLRDEAGFVSFALNAYNVWLAMAFAAVLFGVLWVIHVTRRNYKPIAQLVSLIQTSVSADAEPDKRGKNTNEFGFIRGALEQLMEETNKVRRENMEIILRHKKHRFIEALESASTVKEEEWQAELAKQSLDTAGKRTLVLAMEIDGYREFEQAHDKFNRSLLLFLLSSIVQEIAQLHQASVWAEWTSERQLSAVVWLPEGEAGDAASAAIPGEIMQWVKDNLSFTVTIGCEEADGTLPDIREAYAAAARLLQYKATLGTARVIAPTDVNRASPARLDYYQTVHRLAQALRASDPGWSVQLDELFGHIYEGCYARQEIESLLQFMHQTLRKAFLELSREYREGWQELEAHLLELEDRWETAAELHERCASLFESATDQIQSLRESQQSRVIVSEIRSYIEANYANPELSLDHLSERFVMHTKSISKLFKEEFGENFIDFLIGLRIGKARQLLLESEQSLQEISVQVGYSNYNSFNRAFKNLNGVSPRDFRRYGAEAASAASPDE